MPQEELILEKLDRLMEYNKQQDKKLQEVHEIVTGNGNPSNGMVVKQTKHEAETKASLNNVFVQLKLHWGLFIVVIGVLVKSVFF